MADKGGPRIHVDAPLVGGDLLELPVTQARHVQVLRLQPGSELTVFNGAGGEWRARVAAMGRSTVSVRLEQPVTIERELRSSVTLALGMPANDRMDALVEKATELGVDVIQPLVCERSVLRLSGERAEKRLAHWRGVAVAASEQSGRTRLPRLHTVLPLHGWLASLTAPSTGPAARIVLSPDATLPFRIAAAATGASRVVLSGPEGGLSDTELGAAIEHGFTPASLGRRVLRADTAPLAALAWCALMEHDDEEA